MALEKAFITNTVTGDVVTVQFNPEEYTVNREVNYAQAAIPGLSAPLLQFAHGNMQTLEMELLLDTLESHPGSPGTKAGADVRTVTGKVTGLMEIDSSTHAPPVLLVTWGSLTFTCVLARCTQKFIMFRSDGIPVRAKLTVTFNEFRNAQIETKEKKRETADYSKGYVVGQGETLPSIAAAVWGQAEWWRPIAIHNRIDDPMALGIGRRLLVPQLPFRDPESGEVLA